MRGTQKAARNRQSSILRRSLTSSAGLFPLRTAGGTVGVERASVDPFFMANTQADNQQGRPHLVQLATERGHRCCRLPSVCSVSAPLSCHGFLFAAHNLQPARGSAICVNTDLPVTETAGTVDAGRS